MFKFLKRLRFKPVDLQEEEEEDLFWLNYIPSRDQDSEKHKFYMGVGCAKHVSIQEKELIKELISQGKTNLSWSKGFCSIAKDCGPAKKQCVQHHSLSKGDEVQVDWVRFNQNDCSSILEKVSKKGRIIKQLSPIEHEIMFDDGTIKMCTQPTFTIVRIKP